MNNFTKFSINHPISILMILAAILLCSLVSLMQMHLDFLPGIPDRYLLISTEYEGLPADEIKKLITIPVEDSVTSLKGIKNISSVSRDGISLITVELHWNTSINVALTECKSLIDQCYEGLPSGSSKPDVKIYNPNQSPTITLCIQPKDNDLKYCRYIVDEDIKSRFQRISQVSSVSVIGGEKEEIQVLLNKDKTESHLLTISSIADSISQNNFEYPAGTIQEGNSEFLFKTSGLFNSLEDIADMPVMYDDNGLVRLSDLGKVKYGIEDKTSFFLYNQKEAVCLEIYKKNNASPIELSKEVKTKVEELQKNYGSFFEFNIIDDMSEELKQSIFQLILSAIIGILVTCIVIYIFLKSFRLSLIISSIIPIVILFSVLILTITGKSINIMSLTGIALGIGMVIDPSTITIESICSTGCVDKSKVLEGTTDVISSSIGSTLTTVIVFIPLFFISGVSGKLFSDLSISVISSIIFSCILSFTYVPALFILTSNKDKKKNEVSFNKVNSFYEKTLYFIFKKWFIIPIVLVSLIGLSVLLIFILPKEILPTTFSNKLNIEFYYSPDSSIKKLYNDAQAISEEILNSGYASSVIVSSGIEENDFQNLSNPEKKNETINLLVKSRTPDKCIKFINARFKHSNLQYKITSGNNILDSVIKVEKDRFLLSSESENELSEILDLYKPVAKKIIPENVRNELVFTPSREAASRFSIGTVYSAQIIYNEIEGVYSSDFYKNGREIPIRVKYADDVTSNIEELQDTLIISDNIFVPLRSLGQITNESKENIFYRYGKKDSKILELDDTYKSDPKLISLEKKELNELFSNLIYLLIIVLLLLYCVMGAQFESFLIPFIILISITPAFAGAFIALLIFQQSINLNSIMALVVLFGTSVNNSIILYERINSETEITVKKVIDCSVSKLRSIILTSLTSIVALIPFSIDPMKMNAQSSMSIAVIGGLIFSLVIVLIVIPPILYLTLKRKNHE